MSKNSNTLNLFCTGHKLLLGRSWFSGIGPDHIKPSDFPSRWETVDEASGFAMKAWGDGSVGKVLAS